MRGLGFNPIARNEPSVANPDNMSVTGYKRLLAISLALLVVSVGCVWNLGWKYFNIRTEAQTVRNTIADYEMTRHSMSKWGPDEDAGYLDVYSRQSSKLENPSLSLIMDHERKALIGEIIADLRKKTGKDLGDDPVPWIKMFAHQNQ